MRFLCTFSKGIRKRVDRIFQSILAFSRENVDPLVNVPIDHAGLGDEVVAERQQFLFVSIIYTTKEVFIELD
jgi:hypothetical protein